MKLGDLKIHGFNYSVQRTTKALSRALERLSSGNRLVRFGNDVASSVITNRLNAQLRGLHKSASNINSGLGLLLTADSAISSQMDIVRRMREIAIEGSNELLSAAERANLTKELQGLLQEFRQITETTEFNRTALLDGSFGVQKLQVGPNRGETVDLELSDHRSGEIFSVYTSITETSQSEVGTGVGLGTFTLGTTISSGGGDEFAHGDFDNDDDMDIAFNSGTDIVIKLGDGNGGFTTGTTVAVGATVNSVLSDDFDEDGDADLAFLTGASLVIRLGNGNGSFAVGTTVTSDAPANLSSAVIADFNNDNNIDVITRSLSFAPMGPAYTQFDVWFGNGAGTVSFSSSWWLLGTGQPTTPSAVGDFNEDNYLDFVIGHTLGGTYLFTNDQDGTFTQSTYQDIGTFVNKIEAGDINGDNNLDFLGAMSDGTVSVRLGNGNGTFSTGTTISSGASGVDYLRLKDLDGDNDLDLVLTHASNNYISILYGNGAGTFSGQRTYLVGTGPEFFDFVDINNDTIEDLVIANNTDYTVYLADEETTFEEEETTTIYDLDSNDIHVQTAEDAESLIIFTDAVIDKIAASRSKVSALHSRLDMIAAKNTLRESILEEARSRVSEVDYALETAELVRLQILNQAQVAVFAQANLGLRVVLGLLSPSRS